MLIISNLFTGRSNQKKFKNKKNIMNYYRLELEQIFSTKILIKVIV